MIRFENLLEKVRRYSSDADVELLRRAYVFSALAVRDYLWRSVFGNIREFRRSIRASDGIYVTKELHAWKFVSGRGRMSGSATVSWSFG